MEETQVLEDILRSYILGGIVGGVIATLIMNLAEYSAVREYIKITKSNKEQTKAYLESFYEGIPIYQKLTLKWFHWIGDYFALKKNS